LGFFCFDGESHPALLPLTQAIISSFFKCKITDREMTEMSQHPFRTVELNQDLLSTPFRVQTNWQIITGSASCGKTTLINLLAGKGFPTVEETARLYIEREMAKGRKIQEIRKKDPVFQRRLIDMQCRIEGGLRAADVVFLDRGVPDYLAYCRVFGPNPNEILAECFHNRYASVFMLDPLPFHEDGARDEDASIVDYLGEWHIRDYTALGYNVMKVPVLEPEERVEFILEMLSKEGRI
jgi:predicted ATPase